jgi:hypothetical protein
MLGAAVNASDRMSRGCPNSRLKGTLKLPTPIDDPGGPVFGHARFSHGQLEELGLSC